MPEPLFRMLFCERFGLRGWEYDELPQDEIYLWGHLTTRHGEAMRKNAGARHPNSHTVLFDDEEE